MSNRTAAEKTIGTAVPLSSLRSREGIGTVREGRLFLEWLARSGQGAWQLLPLSRTHLEPGSPSVRVPSPYKGYGIGLDPRYLDGERATAKPTAEELAEFCRRESYWLDTYAAFAALSGHFGTDDWSLWPNEGLRRCDPAAVRAWTEGNAESVESVVLEQWRTDQAFREMKSLAERLGIKLIGDLPFYIPKQSPLVWANQDCFDLSESGEMRRVSGIPNARSTHFGRQLWGHPLYLWGDRTVREKMMNIWRLRLRCFAGLYDTVRLDHAKGFMRYGSLDPRNPKNDSVLPGPGEPAIVPLIECAKGLGMGLFAEDAGDNIEELLKILHLLDVSGIRIIRFAYNEKKMVVGRHHSNIDAWPESSFAYTSTHDTIQLISYTSRLTDEERRILCRSVGLSFINDPKRLAEALRERVLSSPAENCLITLQDWFLWPDRINVPGTERAVGDRNWRWVMPVPIEDLPAELPGVTP